MTQSTLLIFFLVFEAAVAAGILVLVLHIISVRKAIGHDPHMEGWSLKDLPRVILDSMLGFLKPQSEEARRIKEENIELASQVVHLREDLEESVKVLERTKMELGEARGESIKAEQDSPEPPEEEPVSEDGEAEQPTDDAGQVDLGPDGAEGEEDKAEEFWGQEEGDEAGQLQEDAGGAEVEIEGTEGEGAEQDSIWDLDEGAGPDTSEPAEPGAEAGEESLTALAGQAASDTSEPAEPGGEAGEESFWDLNEGADSDHDPGEQEGAGRGEGPETPAGPGPAQPSLGPPDGEGLEGEDNRPESSPHQGVEEKSQDEPDQDFDYDVLEVTLPEEGSNDR